MTRSISNPPTPTLSVGMAREDWTGDALFYEYTQAADPVGSGHSPRIPIRRFSPDLHADGPTRIIPLDLSEELGTPYTATSPALLASFVVLRPGEMAATAPDATSELYYCLHGTGTSTIDTEGTPEEHESGILAWQEGDFFTLPALCTTVHMANPSTSESDGGAVLYRVTDAPLLRYLGVRPAEAKFRPTRFDGILARRRLTEVANEASASTRSRVSVLLASTATPQTLTVTHTLWAMLGVLPVGQMQRPHRHQSVALDLIVDCQPGCYSLLGPTLDAHGAIVDPERVEWEAGGAFVTPPGLWHSHHNESGSPAYLVPIQDAGLHTYLRTLDIRFVPGP